MVSPKRITTAFCLFLIAACAPSPPTVEEPSQVGIPISQCQRVTEPGSYHLTTDLEGAPIELSVQANMAEPYTGDSTLARTCIEITASDVTLDCGGHNLIGSGEVDSKSAGIYIAGSEDPLTDVEVRGCVISSHQIGLYAGFLEGGHINQSEARRNTSIGFYIIASSGLILSNDTIIGNDPDGILILGSREITVSDNEVFYNRMRGITFEGCDDCVVTGNESHSHGVLGFAIYASKDMHLEGNIAHNNRYHGFAILHEAGSATFQDNQSYENESTGFFLQDSRGNQYIENQSFDNRLDGIAVLGDSPDNTFEGNTLRDNSGYGAFLDDRNEGQSFSGNTFSGNILGEVGSLNWDEIDLCIYTGFGREGPCDPVFTGGPNLKNPEAAQVEAGAEPTTGIATPGPASAGALIRDARIVGDPIYYPAYGDLWMATWAEDDTLFLTWGDGTGFGDGYPTGYPAYESVRPIVVTSCGEEYFPCQLWCNLFTCDAELDYPPASLTDAGVLAVKDPILEFEEFSIASIDVPSGEPFFLTDADGSLDIAGENDKPSSVLSIDGRLYFAGHSPAGYPIKGYLAYSDDRGGTWTHVPNSPWGEESNFRVLMLINMGQGYDLNEDGFVYGLGVGSEAQGVEGWRERTVYLTRVPKGALEDYTAFEYFSGFESDEPRWSKDESQATPLDDLHTTGQGSAMYHEGTGRYLFLTTDTGSPEAPTNSGALFEASNPWGPWSQVAVLCFVPECNDGSFDPLWTDGKYIAGLIPKDAGPNYVYFTIAGGDEHYQLQIGKLELITSGD